MAEQSTGAISTEGGTTEGSNTTATTETTAQGEETKANATEETTATKKIDDDEIDKIIQSRLDKAMADERKKSAGYKKELDKLKKEKMSDEELKRFEMEEKETAIAQREKALADKENRLYAVKAIKDAGLDDGSSTALDIVDIVITGNNDTEDTISEKVKTISNLLKKMVAAEVDKTFKTNGRTPNGASTKNNSGKETNNIAAKLGKSRAEQNKKANDVLSFYTNGGKK